MAHRQEITCVCFLDPLPSLATADAAGRVLLWATRSHDRAWRLLLVLRNVSITMSGDLGETHDWPGTRAQEVVQPAPITAIAFRHSVVPDGCQGTQQRGRPEKTRGCLLARGSVLVTGDELGAVKIWDLTRVMSEKLGPKACSAESAREDTGLSVAPQEGKTHHLVYHRDGALSGVSLYVAERFRRIMGIAKRLRQASEILPTAAEVAAGTAVHYDPEGNDGAAERDDRRREPRAGNPGGRRALEGCGSTRPEAPGDLHSREVKAVLDAAADEIDPVASWTAHADSISSLKVRQLAFAVHGPGQARTCVPTPATRGSHEVPSRTVKRIFCPSLHEPWDSVSGASA